jgi:hypothetical protein
MSCGVRIALLSGKNSRKARKDLKPTTSGASWKGIEYGRALLRAWPFAAYFLICVAVQASTGAWEAPFTSYADEPSHFVGAVMARDYLRSGLTATPMTFARNYYQHYPFLAIGHWPPFFYAVMAV